MVLLKGWCSVSNIPPPPPSTNDFQSPIWQKWFFQLTQTVSNISVGLGMPAGEFSVSGSPVTDAGTLGVTWKSQTVGKVFASPAVGSGTPVFRALVTSDIPLTNAEVLAWLQ